MNICIEKEIIANAIISGKTHLYTYPDALKLVENCEHNGFPILGIDSFKVLDAKTQPYMEHSVDWSNVVKNENTFELARAFLKEKRKYGFVFEIVY